MKEFNVTGLFIPEKHYMVDISCKIKKIMKMVDKGAYFTVNRPRQFGKTTIFNELIEELNKKYIVIKTSFEGIEAYNTDMVLIIDEVDKNSGLSDINRGQANI